MGNDHTPTRSTSNAPTPAATAATPSTTETLLSNALAALAQSQTKIAELMERQTDYNEFAKQNAPRRRKSMAEYLIEKPRKRLRHEVYQNGRPVNPAGLSPATIEKLDSFATGVYCDGLLNVVRMADGVNGISSRIHIIYSNLTLEQRITFYMKFPTFTTLVNAVVAEMAARGIAPVREAYADPIEEEINIGS